MAAEQNPVGRSIKASVDTLAQVSIFVKLKMTIRARAGNRAGLFVVRVPTLWAEVGLLFRCYLQALRAFAVEAGPKRSLRNRDLVSCFRPVLTGAGAWLGLSDFNPAT
jgi:hypothetical protein